MLIDVAAADLCACGSGPARAPVIIKKGVQLD